MAKPNTESRFVELRRKFQAWLTQSAPSGVMRLDLQVLEDRVLYSATPLPVDAAESIDANLDHLDSSMQAVVADPYAPQPDSSANGAPAPSTDASNSSLIASLDASLADLDLLLAQQDPASDSDDHSIDAMWPDAPSSESSHPDVQSDVHSDDVPTSPDHLRHEVIFVQSTLYDLDRLTADLFDGEPQDRVLHVITLDQSVSGFEQIDAALAQYSNLDAIHFVTHGTDGFIQLGGSWLTYWNVDAHAADLQRWGMALHADGDILIYGCDVAASQTGQNMLDSIALFTQADVAASTDSTGSIARGGNWDLEWSSGEIETNLAFSSELQNSYESLWATYTVTSSSGGTGAGTLRAAITNANSNPGFDTIVFNIGTGVQTINLSGAIANISGAVFIDGTTQGGYSNTPLIVVNGGGSIQDGFRLYSGSGGSTIRGLVIQNFTQDGIDIYQSNGNTIVGNYIGITQAGTAAAGNQIGINIYDSSNSIVGGTTAADRNVISSNTYIGIAIAGSSTNNHIQGNYIGTNAAGTADLGNATYGISVDSSGNTIGGSVSGAGNVISGTGTSGTSKFGIALSATASGTTIQGNYIGTNAAGTSAIVNQGIGIEVLSSSNTIGGTTSLTRNVISGNAASGISIWGASATGNMILGNYIGLNAAGTTALGNGADGIVITSSSGTIIGDGTVAGRNVISGNTGRGIYVYDGAGTVIRQNYVGTDGTGTLSRGNTGYGIEISDSSSVIIDTNLISGNTGGGISLWGASTTLATVTGNYIGTNAAGTAALGNNNDGIKLGGGANNNTIGGDRTLGKGNVISGNSGSTSDGIELSGSSGATNNNKIYGNLIGTNATGTAAIANGRHGIVVYNGAQGTLIGGTGTGQGNTISGNTTFGIIIDGNSGTTTTGTIIAANYIGLNLAGTAALGNGAGGISLFAGARTSTIGGTTAAHRNVISGNIGPGIQISGSTTQTNTVQGNYVGTNAAGTADLGNTSDGIEISAGANGNVIGGVTASARNVISGNNNDGIWITGSGSSSNTVQGNWIGFGSDGSDIGNSFHGIGIENGAAGNLIGGTAVGAGNQIGNSGWDGVTVAGSGTGNALLGNSIVSSGNLGIDLGDNDVTANDPSVNLDSDTGSNNLQNYPVITSADSTGSQITIAGTINSNANSFFRVEFFANTANGGSGYGEGQRYLGFANVATDGSGSGTFNEILTQAVSVGEYISATATKSVSGYATFTDTSEFAQSFAATGSNAAPTVVDSSVNASEDVPYVFGATDFGYSDTDGDPLSKIQVVALPTAGQLKLNGVAVTLNQEISRANIDAGLLTFTAAPDANGIGYDNFEYRAHDGTEYSNFATIVPQLTGTFDSNSDGFTYADLVNGSFANGTYDGAGGSSGGGLRIDLAGAVTSGATSGGWSNTFTLTESTDITISTDYRLRISSEYEATEYGELLLQVNGTPYGNDTNTSLIHQVGDGNGGAVFDSGWQTYQTTITLGAGTHTLALIASNNDSTAANEWVEGYFDNVTVTSGQHAVMTVNVAAVADTPIAVNDFDGLDFDGIDDYVNLGSDTDLVMTNTMTMEVWVRPEGYPASTSIILNKEGEYEIGISSTGMLRWAFKNTTPGWAWHDTGYTLALNQWNHISITYNSGVVSTYANGNLVETYHGSGAIDDAYTGMNDLRIGSRTNNPAGQYFEGQIDDVRIWNVVRNQTEIRANLDQDLVGNEAGLQGYWRFNEGSGVLVTDLTGKSAVGTLVDGGSGTVGPQWTGYRTNEETQINVSAADGILSNDIDGEGNTLTVTQVNGNGANVGAMFVLPSGAQLTVGTDGAFAYNPKNAFDYLAPGQVATDAFTYQVSDGNGGFDTATASVTVTGLNDAPTNVVPPAQTTAEDTLLVFNTANNNRILISDDAGDVLRVTLSVADGTLTLSQTTGLTFASGANGTANFTITGTVGDINTALNGLQYAPTEDYNGADTLMISTADAAIYQLNIDANLLGRYDFNAASPGADSSPSGTNTATLNGGTTVVSDPAHGDVISLGGSGDHAFIASNFGNSTNVTLAAWVNLDTADTQGSQVIQISDRVGIRLDNPTGDIVAYFNNGSGTSSITFSESLAGTSWRHVAFTFDDTLDAMKLYIDGVEVATKTVGTSINYAGASVGTKIGGLGNTAGYDFNGKIDDARIVGRALSAGEIASLASVPGAATDADSVAITVTAVNDAPVLDDSGFLSLTTITENDTNNGGNTVAQILASDSGNPITDPDSGAMEGIAVFSTGGANGRWQYNTGAGWTDVGTVSVSSSLLLRPTDSLRYVPNGVDGDTGSIVFCAWDQTTDTAGSRADTSSDGGTTAFSDATDSAIISVTSINDAPSFHQGTGLVTTGFGAGTLDYINAIAIQPDGKIIAVGYTQNAGNNDFAVARYNTDGSLDTSFGGGTGKVATAIGIGADNAKSVKVLANGKILVVGSAIFSGSYDIALVQYNADGSLDTSFGGGDGIANSGIAGSDEGNCVAVQSDGKILVAGSDNSNFLLARFLSDGSLDTSYGTSGRVSTDFAGGLDKAYSMTLQADGKALLGGLTFNGTSFDFGVVRYHTDGTHDTSFNSTGKVSIDLGANSNDTGYAITTQTDGKILLSGWTDADGGNDFGLVRLNSNGSLDTTFNGTGKVVTPIGSGSDLGLSVTVQSDGKILVAGQSNTAGNNFAAVRYNSDGSLDTTFGDTGKVDTNFGGSSDDRGAAVLVQSDGKILVAGTSTINGNYDFAIGRFNTDGSLDARFNTTSTLGGTVAYTEGGSPVVLDNDVSIFDIELSSLNNFSGASLTLVRSGGTNAQDQFSATGLLGVLTQAGNLVYNGTTIGTVTTNSGGTLVLTFNSNATQTNVNAAMRLIGYSNNSDTPPSSVQINWTFNDGNSGSQGTGGALTANGSTTVNITATNDEQALAINTGMTVLEGSAGNVITTAMLQTTDVDNTAGQLVYTVTGVPTNGFIRLSGIDLTVSSTFTQADIDAGIITYLHNDSETSSDSFTFTVDDGSGTISGGTFIVTVTAVNDNNPIITSNSGGATASINVNENATTVTTVTATDADLPSQTLTYSKIGGADSALFTVDGSTGVLSFITAPDYENPTDIGGDNTYEVVVQVSDGTLTDTQTITVSVKNVADGIRVTPLSTGPLGGETLVNTTTSNVQSITSNVAQAIAADASGNYVVVWGSNAQDGDLYGIFAQRFNADGVPQGTEFQINSTTTDQQLTPTVAMDRTGNFVVTWMSNLQDGDSYGIYAQRYNAAGVAQGSEFLVNSTTVNAQTSPAVAMAANGSFIINWTSSGQDPDSSSGIYAQRFDASGVAMGGEFRVNTYTSGTQQLTSIAADSAGNFVITWASDGQDGSNYGVFGQRFDAAGAAQGAEFQVNTTTADSQLYHDVTMLEDGRFAVAYQSRSGSTYEIYVQRYAADGTTVGGETRINTTTVSGTQPFPSISADADGNITVVWNNTGDGAGAGVYGQRLDWAGNSIGSEFLVNSTTSGNQSSPEVVAQTGGRFIVAWGGNGSGDADGVFMQRYGLTTTEAGGTATFQIVLETAPSADVTIPINVSDGTEGSVSVGTVTFTTANWNAPQTVTVTGLQDYNNDGNQVYSVVLGSATSSDANFNGLDPDDISVVNLEVPNIAPVNSIPSAQSTNEDTTLVFSSGNGNPISINDSDAGSNTLQVTLSVTNGSITLGGTSGLTFSTGDGSSDAIMTFTGTVANVNAALSGLSFAPTANFNGAASITITTNDQGNSGTGGAQSDSDVVNITVHSVNDAPVAQNGTNTATEDGAVVNGTLAATDADTNDTHTYALIANTSEGSATVQANGDYTFDPGADFQDLALGETRDVTFTYEVTDNNGATSQAIVTITVTGTNDGPIAQTSTNTATEDGAVVNGTLSATDADTNDTHTYALIANTSEGSATVQANGDYSFDPGADFQDLALGETRDVTFTYEVTDNNGATSQAIVTITVTGTNDGPVAQTGTNTATEDGAVVNGTLSETDADTNDTYTYALITNTSEGSVTVQANGDYSFDPGADFQDLALGETRDVTFTYEVTDNNGAASQAVVTITVTGTNDGPVAQTGTNTATEDGAVVNGTLAATDADTNDTHTYALITNTSEGSATVQANGDYSFDPGADFQDLALGETRDVTFTYEVTDNNGAASQAVVTITVTGTNDGPVAQNGTNTATEDGAVVNGTLSETDADTNDTHTYALITNTSEGSATVQANGDYSFDPGADFQDLALGETRDVTFTYEVTDNNGATSQAVVTITVTGTNDGPVAQTGNNTATEDGAVVNGTLAATDADTNDTHTYALITNTSEGSATVQANGDYSFDPGADFQDLALGETRDVTFTYEVTDNNGATSQAVVTITVTGTNDSPVAQAGTNTATEDGAVVDGALSETDADTNDTHTYALITNTSEGSVTVQANGDYSFDPGADFQDLALGETRDVTFTYEVTDNNGATSQAIVTITVTGTNDGPVAQTGTNTATEDGAVVNGTLAATDDDTNDTHTYALITNTSEGSVTVQSNGDYSFDPGAGFQDLALGETRDVTFTYEVTDNNGATSQAVVTITVTGTNDGPVAQAGTNTATEDGAVVNGTLSETDADTNDTHTYALITNTSEGSVTVQANGDYSFDPGAGFQDLALGETRDVTFTYEVTDNNGATSQAVVTITVTGTNDGPVAQTGTNTATEDGAVVNGTLSETDADTNDTHTYALITNTSEGSVTVQANGDYSFDPGADFQDLALGETRDVTFTYEVTDNNGATSQAIVTITVTGTNDEQVIANNLGMTVDEGTTGSVLTSAMLATTDVDNLDSELVYTVSTQTVNGTLRLNGAALAINYTFTQADIAAGRVTYDHNGSETSSDSFAFTVDDGIGGASNGSFVISVSPVNNHTPVITSNGGGASATIHVDENSAAITTVTATDGDLPTPTLTYSLVGGVDSGWFTIDANTGELQFIAGRDRESATDFDGDHTYEVIVRASDGTLSTTQAISVVIDDVNEFGVGTVTDTNASANQVNENSAPGTLVGLTVKATDSDATNNTITYSLVDDDHGRFAIDSVTGVVRLIGPVDYEADGASRTIRAQATSSDGSTSESDFSIAIVNANEAPQAVPGEYTTSYIDDLAVNLLSNAVNGVDPDGDVVTAVIVQGPASGTATLLGDGSLRYHPQPGFVGTVSLTYYVTDGSLNSAVETVLIHVTLPTNLPPADMGGGGGTGSTSGTGSGGATSTASPPSQAANHSLSAPGPIDQSSQAAASTHVVQVAIAQLDTSTARALQTVELAREVASSQSQLFLNNLAGMDLLSPETERLELDANSRTMFKQASMTQLVFAEVSELIDADSQSVWISQIDPYVATAVGTGIVIWLVHAGQFAAALLSTASTWVQLDPLTVLQGAGESEVGESLEEKMFEREVD